MLAAVLAARPAAAQAPEPLPPNPFGEFQSFRLANGLKVWYRYLPGSGVAAAALTVPYGWDHDPPGREGTAHFLEHVLLSDRNGRSDVELRRELEARGGSFGGTTSANRTTYNVLIGGDQAQYGIRWLGDALAPRVISDALIARTREPVAIETQARRRSPFEKLARIYLLHPALQPARFWEREFGLDVWQERLVERHDALHAITGVDLQAFYDTYYAPQQMTLMIVGDVAWRDVEPVVQETFGSLPWRPTPPPPPLPQVDSQYRARHYWSTARNTQLQLYYRIADVSGRDDLRLIFLEDLLTSRLFERLRLGGSSLIYSVAAFTETRGPAGFFGIGTAVTPAAEEAARAVIEAEIERIRNAAADTAFYTDRDALARQLRLQNTTATALQAWLLRRFYEPSRYDEFPDLGTYYATVGADSIAAFGERLFAPHNTILEIVRPVPLSPVLIALLALGAIAAAVLLYRRLTLKPVDMSRVRFVGRLRPPTAYAALRLLLLLAVVLVGGRLLAAALAHAADRWLLPVDSFAVHLAAALILIAAVTFTVIAIAGTWPRKILVFEHELRIKTLTYRSTVTPLEDIESARLCTAAQLRRAGKRVRGHGYGGGEGVCIELKDGAALLFHVRDDRALLRALQHVLTEAPRLGDAAGDAASDVSAAPSRPDDGSADRSE